MPRRHASLPTAVLVAATVVAACGGDDDGGGGDGAAVDVLARVPAAAAAAEGTLISYVDMEEGWARLGLADASPDERFAQIGRTAELDTFLIPPPLFGTMAALREEATAEVGFDMTAIERGVDVSAPPHGVAVVVVAADETTIADAVESDPGWSDRLRTDETDAGTVYDWGEELDVARRSPLHELGEGGQLLVDGDGDESTVVRTRDAATMDDVVSLHEDDSLASAPWATELDRLVEGELVQFMAVPEAMRFDPAAMIDASPEEIEQLQADMTDLVDPYDAIVIAESTDDGSTRSDLLLVYSDEQEAAANVERVSDFVLDGVMPSSGQPASGSFPGARVEQDGPTVVVSLEGTGHFARWSRGLMIHDLFPSA